MRAAWAIVVSGIAVSFAACDRSQAETVKPGSPEEVVARIDGQPITRAEFERHLARQSPFVQARYASPERRKELLANLVRFEVMAREAAKARLRPGPRRRPLRQAAGD